MTETAHEQALRLFKEAGALLEGHFVGTSGRHLEHYVNKDALYVSPYTISTICRLVAQMIAELGLGIDVVLGPACGGIVLSQWTAFHLSEIVGGDEVHAVFADKNNDGTLVLKRGYDRIVKGSRVLVTEDILNTGKSTRRSVDLVTKHGGFIIGVSALWNRSSKNVLDLGLGTKLYPLIEQSLPSWAATPQDPCPLCDALVPINTEFGHGRKYLATLTASNS